MVSSYKYEYFEIHISDMTFTSKQKSNISVHFGLGKGEIYRQNVRFALGSWDYHNTTG